MVHFNYEDLRTIRHLITAEIGTIHDHRRSFGFFNESELERLEYLNMKIKKAIMDIIKDSAKAGE